MKKRFIPLSLLASLFLIGGISSISGVSLHAQNEVADLLEEYDYLDEIEIPHYTFEVGNEKVEAEGTIIYPDGTAFKKATAKLDQYGVYKINYSKNHNGKLLSKTISFVVRKNLITYKNINTHIYNEYIPAYASNYTSAKGTYIELAKGDTVTFEKEFDAKTYKGQNFISGFITPGVSEEYDMSVLVVTLTDSLNPNIYLKWELNTSVGNKDWYGVSYMRTCGNGQTIGGWNTEKGEDNGYFQNNMGTKVGAIPFSNRVFVSKGVYKVVDPSDYPFKISFNNDTLETTTNDNYVADYDDAKCYNKFWDGFPSGRCKLSISADKFYDSYARFCITSIDGINVSEKKSSMQNNDEISVDFDTNNMPEACAGKAYKIPSASSKNGYKINTKVYYNYGSSNQVVIYNNGSTFVPIKIGLYTIVYSTTNVYGSEVVETVSVHCGSEIPQITGTISGSFVKTCNIGEIVSIPEMEDLHGGSGELNVQIIATKDGKTIKVENNTFQPLETGTWTITYQVSDYNNTVESFSSNLTVNESTIPAFDKIESINEYYLSNYKVDVPQAYGYTFVNGVATRKACDVRVTDANGVKTYTNGQFSPSVNNNNDSINIEFMLDGHVVHTYEAKGIILYDDDGNVHFENYILGEGYTLQRENTGVRIKHTGEIAEWSFYSKLIANNFELILNNDANGATNFSSMTVTIRDIVDSTISASVRFDSILGKNTITVSGKTYDFDFDYRSNQKPLSVAYDNGQFNVNNVHFSVLIDDNGNEFGGFPSDFVYVEVNTVADNSTSYIVSALNGSSFVGNEDLDAPEFHICGTYAGKFDIGTVYKVNRIIFNDILSPTCTASLSVKDKNGNYVTATNGTLLRGADPTVDYEIVLEEYGIYTFAYAFEDGSQFISSANSQTYIYKVTCMDFVSPEIITKTSWTKEAKVGDIIVMPDFEVTDNYSSKEKITVVKSVVTPYGTEIILEDDENAIKTKYKGTYVFKVLAYDEYGNSAMAQFSCVVK